MMISFAGESAAGVIEMVTWPQMVVVIWYVFSLIANTVDHGKARHCNVYGFFLRTTILGWLLYEGGFWHTLISR